VIWSNQWEPGKKEQHAFNCYIEHFKEGLHINDDIAIAKKDIPKSFSLLVGGFPCQDYSVATTKAKGIHGKKGVLWWDINDILISGKPPFVLLENVDRLLRSPTAQRGRDFAIILWCFNKLGYHVEWRMINAADYGFPQKRRRTFIFAVKNKTVINKLYKGREPADIFDSSGLFAREFPVAKLSESQRKEIDINSKGLSDDLQQISDNFETHLFNAGYMSKGKVFTIKVTPISPSRKMSLKDILVQNVQDEYYLNEKDIKKWRDCKGAKSEYRKSQNGHEYFYSEGAIPFPDPLEKPSRTMLTGEGNTTPNRITHVIEDNRGYRVLSPEETEKLNGFPPGWTNNMPKRWRYFCMGNALVVGVVERIGKKLQDLLD
jgi:DNA (cytosine-5)-methyltransferase 1